MNLFICLLDVVSSLFDLSLPGISGKDIRLSNFKGRGILLVNKVLQGLLAIVIMDLQAVFFSHNIFGTGGMWKFGKDFYDQSFVAGFAGVYWKGDGRSYLEKLEESYKHFNFAFLSVVGFVVGGDYTKKFIVGLPSKEYKKYISKSLKFDRSPINNFFFQVSAYTAGGFLK